VGKKDLYWKSGTLISSLSQEASEFRNSFIYRRSYRVCLVLIKTESRHA
jgi:hypothetical protein